MDSKKIYGVHIIEPLPVLAGISLTIQKEDAIPVYEDVENSLVHVTLFIELSEVLLRKKLYTVVADRSTVPDDRKTLKTLNIHNINFGKTYIEFGSFFLPKSASENMINRYIFIGRHACDKYYNYVKYGQRRKIVLDTSGVTLGDYYRETVPGVPDCYNPLEDSAVTHFTIGCFVVCNVKLGVEITEDDYPRCKYFVASKRVFGHALYYMSNCMPIIETKLPSIVDYDNLDYEYPKPLHRVSS